MDQRMKWLRWPLEHYPITLLLVVLLFVMGIYGMYVMPKDEFPAFTIRQGVVVAVYPGATTEEVEQQVTRPLERYLFTFGEVNRRKTTSTSQNGMAIVMVRLNDNVNNKDEVWSKIKHGLTLFKQQLPQGVLALVANDDFGNTSALLIAIESPERSYRELQFYTDELSDRLRRVPSVANVRIYGEQKEQVSLYIDRERLQAYGMGLQTLFAKLQQQGLTTTSGSISNAEQQTPIHIAPTENSEEQIANLIIFSDPVTGKVGRVRDVARVVREYDPDASYIEQDGHPCVLLSLEMTPGNNIVQYGKDVDRILNDYRQNELPDDVTVTRIADQPKVVGKSVSDFLRDLLISMAIIILVMMVLFPLRSAIVAAITIPLSTFISVAFMYMMDIELNIVTLAALIVVLGMVVDNSIVVIDGYLEYLGKGYEPKEAAIKSSVQYFMPMMLATLCISVIFYPLLLTMRGSFHDALQDFPITITVNLMVSLFLAVTVIPFLEVLIIKPGTSGKPGKPETSAQPGTSGNAITRWVQSTYDGVLDWTFRHPWLTIGGGIGVVLLSLLIVPTLKVRVFPYADRDQFAIEIFLPEGKGISETRTLADSLRHVLQQDGQVKCITSFIGCSSPRFMVCYAPQMAGKNYAQFIVNTTSQQATLDLIARYQPRWSEAFPEAYVRFKRLDYLEVSELEFRFYGEDLDSLHTVAERMMDRMRELPELEWVHTDFLLPRPIIDVQLDPVSTAQLGISRTTVALTLSGATGQLRVGQLWERQRTGGQGPGTGDYEVPIVVKDTCTLSFSDIENIGVATPFSALSAGLSPLNSHLSSNTTVPLRQIAKVVPRWSESRIMHRGGERCITATAQFAQGVYGAPVKRHIADIMKNEIALPQGVRAEVGGEKEYDSEALPQIFGGVAIAMVIVFFFLLFNFKKYGITLVCIAALGLMLPGGLIGLGLMNRTLGLTSIMGVITLMGMIMRNEILIFEHANDYIKREGTAAKGGHDASLIKRAAYEAGRRRMVPIFLTTATTAVGVIPMIIAGSSFWMPVGVTIFAGGIGSLIMVVTMMPVVYWKTREHRGMKRKTTLLLFLTVACSAATAQASTPPPQDECDRPTIYTLDQLKDSAMRNNLLVRQASLSVDAAREQRREAFTKFFPTVSAMGAWFNADHDMAKVDIDPMQFVAPKIRATMAQILPAKTMAALSHPLSMTMMKSGVIASVTAIQPVFAGGQIVNGNRLARVGEKVSQQQLRLKENEVEKQTEQYFWQLVSLKEKTKTLDAVDSLLTSIFKDVDAAVRAGVAMRNDLLQVQLRQNEVESQRVKLQNGIRILKLVIGQYCSLNTDLSQGVEGSIYNFDVVVPPMEEQDHLPLATPEERSGVSLLPEYQLLEKQVEVTSLQTKMAVGQQLPTVAVGAGYNYHYLMENERTNALIFATVSIPISDWWGGSHAIRRKKLEHRKALDQLTDNTQLLNIRMEKAISDVAEARQQLSIAQRAIEQAEENLRIGRNQYRAGVSRMSDLLEAQLLYQQTLDRRTEAWAELQNRLLDYRQATGQP